MTARERTKAILTDSHFWLPAMVAVLGVVLLVVVGRL